MAQQQGTPSHGGRHSEHHGGAEEDFGDWFDSWGMESGDDTPQDASREEGRLVAFAREYGWRAYAIPVLAVITVFVLLDHGAKPG